MMNPGGKVINTKLTKGSPKQSLIRLDLCDLWTLLENLLLKCLHTWFQALGWSNCS